MHKLNDDTLIAAKDGLIASDMDGEYVILNLESGTYYGIEGVGAAVWKQIQKPTALARVRQAVLDEFDVQSEQCASDISKFLNDLNVQGLIVCTNDA